MAFLNINQAYKIETTKEALKANKNFQHRLSYTCIKQYMYFNFYICSKHTCVGEVELSTCII